MRMQIAAILLFALATISAALPFAQATAATNKYAVAVIIDNKYYTGSVPDVDFAHNDAVAMKRFVIEVLGFREGNIIDLRDTTKGRRRPALVPAALQPRPEPNRTGLRQNQILDAHGPETRHGGRLAPRRAPHQNILTRRMRQLLQERRL